MGHVTIRVSLSNPLLAGKGKVVEKALVDTGATFTTIPQPIARKLGLKSIGKRQVKTAARSQTLTESFAHIEVDGKSTVYATPHQGDPGQDSHRSDYLGSPRILSGPY